MLDTQNQNQQPTSNRINQLKKIAQQLPVANQAVANQMDATRQIQMQDMIKRAPVAAGPAVAQQIGGQQAQQRGQIAMQTNEQNQKDLTGLAQTGLQQQQNLATQNLGTQRRAVSERQRVIENQLYKLSSDAKNQLLDKQLEFKTDEQGRAFLNERQLADWAIMNAHSEEDFLNYAQNMEQVSERKIKMLQAALTKVKQTLEQGYISEKQALDNDSKKRMLEAQAALKERIQKEFSSFAARKAMFVAGGTIAGAVIGGVLGGGAGAVPGAVIGGGVGSAAAGMGA